MNYINPSQLSIKTCFQCRYTLPFFQREYKWEPKHFEDMISDIQSAFLGSYSETDSRKNVSQYTPYFLGAIITSNEMSDKKSLIDGQQRITSIFVLLAYLDRYIKTNDIKEAYDISKLLYTINYGDKDFSVDFSFTRKEVFNKYLDTDSDESKAFLDIDSIPSLDQGDQKIIVALQSIHSILDDRVLAVIPFFIDYLVEKVMLIEIMVQTENEAHRVFVTMNDRGLRLGPLDLLKGRMLSKIRDDASLKECHRNWIECINKLREDDQEGDSLFFKNLFRSKWANTIRGKQKGDKRGDYDLIGDEYHRWFVDNAENIGFYTEDDYYNFILKKLPFFTNVFLFIKNHENEYSIEYQAVYYNSLKRSSLQPMILLAAIKETDTQDEWKKKIQLLSSFLDLVLSSRIIEAKSNTYDNLRDIAFDMVRSVRDKSLDEIKDYVLTEWPRHYAAISKLPNLTYSNSDKSDLLFILARIACFLEEKLRLSSKVGFVGYCQRDRGNKTFDIEHLLCKEFDSTKLPLDHEFADARDYSLIRNFIGALTLLPRSRNRSLQDKSYNEKRTVYATENILTQSLCDNFHQNNPILFEFKREYPEIKLNSIDTFAKKNVYERASVYLEIAREIWKYQF
ncbi:DUF262 domain-containing protein [Paenibacillus sp. FSL R7-0331]|uniref:DUF262 domain-containing protein n=1 Tax=Paenibacillus sp. FSL R7-0331 TaxID=1536773 RepID=UPI0004F62F7E|nr:DUF262 domain-containing protein [Paenibacillus sp. FSL R7-0331]AIQ53810.1 hypothetical protein R70331_21295 [Paenibacillus sp. FSL R7-0331]